MPASDRLDGIAGWTRTRSGPEIRHILQNGPWRLSRRAGCGLWDVQNLAALREAERGYH